MQFQKKVTVLCVTYNHRAYIGQCLESLVVQKTNFPFEVIVHDDASTDGSAEIIRDYADRYPHIIKPILQEENQWRKGKTMSKTFIYPHITGEYVSYCEGDDYWTDENKLQKQVDFLDAHPDYAVCFHPVSIKWEGGVRADSVFPSPAYRFHKTDLELSDLLKQNFIQTNSVLLRWRFHKDPYDLIPDRILPGDWFIFLLHAELGKIKMLPDVMGVYRKHAASIWYGARRTPEWFIRKSPYSVRFFEAVRQRFGYEHTNELVLMEYGKKLALEEQEHGKTLWRTWGRCIKIGAFLFAYLFSRNRTRIVWKNRIKALLISLAW